MAKRVCLLHPEHAEALEHRNVLPDCRYHEHMHGWRADELIEAETHRSVSGPDGVRRMTTIRIREPLRGKNVLVAPPHLHYPIPAVADHRISWMARFMRMPNKLNPEPA